MQLKLDTKFSDKKSTKAFWINVYNLHVIKSVIDVFPFLRSKVPFTEAFVVGNQDLTLDDIENVILRDLFLIQRYTLLCQVQQWWCSTFLNGLHSSKLRNK
jgi:hypothetical protein